MKSALLILRRFVLPERDLQTRIGRDIPLMYVEDRDSLERLREAAQQCRKTRTWHRVQAVILAKQGDTAPGIARALGVSRRAVQTWVTAYNRGGLDALPDRPHPGRAPILPSAPRRTDSLSESMLRHTPRTGSPPCGSADIRRILEQEFAARYSLDGVYKLLHRPSTTAAFVPRPQHEEADAELQAIFKEVVIDQIEAIAEAHPGERDPRSGMRTRPASASKGRAHTGLGPPRLGGRRRVRQNGRTSLYVLTAVCAAVGTAAGADRAGVEHGGGERVLGAVLASVGPRRARGVALGCSAGYHVGKDLVWCQRTW